MWLADAVTDVLARLGADRGRALVAVSGGPDSVALLDALAHGRERHRLELVVAHVDHGIHPESATVAQLVARLAERYGLPFESTALALGPGASETLARRHRYAWLEQLRRRLNAEWILTAHHADDQIETVLLRAFGGSGPAGLAGIAERRGPLVRPLVGLRRAELAGYVRDRGLPAWEDPANADPRHRRAWLRTTVLPLLRDRIPDLDRRLLALGGQAALDRAGWDGLLDAWPAIGYRAEPQGVSVAAAPLVGYDSPLALGIIMAAARRAGLVLGPTRARRVLALAARGASGRSCPLGGGWRAELEFDRICFWSEPTPPAVCPPLPLRGEGTWQWGRWTIRSRLEPAPARQPRDGRTAWFIPADMTVRAWRPGDRIRPIGGTGRRPVVRCFQEARISRRRRAGWPVLELEGGAVWVPGVCRSDRLLPREGMESLRVDVTDP